jgi:hypothetical protein
MSQSHFGDQDLGRAPTLPGERVNGIRASGKARAIRAANARVIATALLPNGAPLTIDPVGFSSDVYAGPTDGYRVLDSVARTTRSLLVLTAVTDPGRPGGSRCPRTHRAGA